MGCPLSAGERPSVNVRPQGYAANEGNRPRHRDFSPRNGQIEEFRIVCRTCNGGWMSQLEDQAKPFLAPMMQGKALLLPSTALDVIARWTAVKVMVAEFYRPEHSVLSAIDRCAFRERSELPIGMTIRLARCTEPSWQAQLVMQSAGLRLKRLPGTAQTGRTIQTTTIGFGQIFVHAVVRKPEAPDLDAGIAFRVGTLKIWPSMPPMAYWPPAGSPISAAQAEYIARRLQLEIHAQRTEWGDVAPS